MSSRPSTVSNVWNARFRMSLSQKPGLGRFAGSAGAGIGARASPASDDAGVLAASFPAAPSPTMVWPYSACSSLAFAAAEIASGPMVSISDRGERILVHATGVGAPFSDSTVTIASPMPSDVSADSRSYTSVFG